MMDSVSHIRKVAVIMAAFALAGCNGPWGPPPEKGASAPTYDGINARKSALLAGLASSILCNAGKGEAVREESDRLHAQASRLSSSIKELLDESVREAFVKERTAYGLWYATQRHLSDRVIIAFWDLYAGGSAGASFQTAYLYDVENVNYEDMDILHTALLGKPTAVPNVRTTTPCRLEREKGHIFREAEERKLPGEVVAILNRDYHLFKLWMDSRDELSRLLPQGTAVSYGQMTRLIITEHLRQYETRFIGENNAANKQDDNRF